VQVNRHSESALRAVIAAVEDEGGVRLVAVAHRVVHGGTRFSASVRIDDATQAFLESLNPLAPLHQPHNLAGVKAFRKACPDIPQVACFDTAFHTTAPDLAQRFALPQSYFEQGVRRYGFHGLSYRYVSERLAAITPRGKGRLLMPTWAMAPACAPCMRGAARARRWACRQWTA
jgi:acetate kinase